MSMINPATPQMKREDYKAIKHMNKEQLTAYLSRVYRRGYEAGLKATAEQGEKADPEPQQSNG